MTPPTPSLTLAAYQIVLSWFGCGLAPRAPGTVGSLGAIPFAALIAWVWGPLALIPAAVIVFILGWWVAARYLRGATAIKDPQWIVIDEVAGQWIALAAVPLDFIWYALGFGLFRFFDILKPWPVRWADRRVPGALGIMLDDVLAGLYAAGVALVLRALWTQLS